MSHGPRAICDRCGFEFWLDQLRKEWTGLMVCGQCWDPRHPQEFVRGVRDSQGVRPNMRPETADVFVSVPTPSWYPANLTLPVVSGVPGVASTLSVSTGTWSGFPTSFTHQWTNGGVAIDGETAATYDTVAGDLGDTISCIVTAHNDAGGSGSATATGLLIIAAPSNTVAPAITGTLTVGQLLSCSTGTWSGGTPIVYSYQWLRDGAEIVGATSSTYTLVTADQGTQISCEVVATNDAGATPIVVEAVDFVGNLLTAGRDFSNAAWTKSDCTIAGAGTSDQRILEAATSAVHFVRQSISKAASAINYRLQFDVKILGRNFCLAETISSDFGSGVGGNYNLSTGNVGTEFAYGTQSLFGSFSIIALPDGFRIIRDITSDTGTVLRVQIAPCTADNTNNYAGDITKGVYVTKALLYAL